MGAAAKTIDGFLATLEPAQRAALERLRSQIHAAAPGCEECISYGMPAMKHNGRMLVWFAAAARHCALYPGAIVADFEAELEAFGTSKGTIRFTPVKPIPAALVKRIVKACVARNAARGGARNGNAKAKAAPAAKAAAKRTSAVSGSAAKRGVRRASPATAARAGTRSSPRPRPARRGA
jgi:uncharacterized protein YdhG (YjbR/CyaY superfamily)